MVQADRTFRIFVSSTFDDLKEERNALQEQVFPELRKLCMEHGCRLQAIDLRWGVSEEAGYDQQTMKICLEEIKRCQKTTPKPNFILLLGDRYGWQPLPHEIPVTEFKEIEKSIQTDDRRKLLNKWYKCDNNAVPSVFCLQPRIEEYRDRDTWRLIEKELKSILQKATLKINLSDDARLKYMASATELEIIKGALNVEDAKDHVFGFFRTINGLPEDESAKEYIDLDINNILDIVAGERLKELKKNLRHKIGKSNIIEYESNWNGNGITNDHIPKLCEDVKNLLGKIIKSQIDNIERIDTLDYEISVHSNFAKERSRIFVGRVDTLNKIDEYIDSDNNYPLCVYGPSGSGKTALMAKATKQASRRSDNAIVINRFIGATPESSDIRKLLRSLCLQISRCYSLDETTIPVDYQKLVNDFWARLNHATEKKPLVLFLDALGQLSDIENAKNLTWLPYQLPDNVYIVVSALLEDCYSVMEKRVQADNMIHLKPLNSDDGSKILDLWLAEAGRTLQPQQRSELMNKFSINGLPLYLKLAFEESKNWKSYTKINECTLSPDIPSIIDHKLDVLSLESNHGFLMVSKSLGYIAASRYGLAEDEIIDILSADKEVMTYFKYRSPNSPIVDKLPLIIWSRLYFDLEPYLMKRNINGVLLITYYHRQLKEVVKNRYLLKENSKDIHLKLASYFESNKLDNRKIDELPWQLHKAKSMERLKNVIVNIDMFLHMCNKTKEYELVGYWLDLSYKYDMVKEYLDVLNALRTQLPEEMYSFISNQIASFFEINARYDGAEILFRQTLTVNESTSGPEHPETSTALSNLARVLLDKGDFTEAEPLLRRALAINEKVLGTEHLDTVNSLNDLAYLLIKKGDFKSAEPMLIQVVKVYEKNASQHQYPIIGSLYNLAELLSKKGDYTEAEPLLRKVLALCEKISGPNHPNTANSLNNLAGVLDLKGNYSEAELLYRKALEIREKVLGPRHPKTSHVLNNLSILFVKKQDNNEEDYTEAELLIRRALDIREEVLGPEHPDTATALNNLAEILDRKGNYAEAEPLYRRALEIREKVLGPENPDTGTLLYNLAKFLERMGDNEGVEPLLRRELDIMEKTLGPEHQFTAQSLNNLATFLDSRGNSTEAESLYRRTLVIREEVLGPKHADTLISIENLARFLDNRGNNTEAEQLYRRVLAIREEVSGKEHPVIVKSLNNLADLLVRKGEYTEAELLLRQVIAIKEKISGTEHLDIVVPLNNLADVLVKSGDNVGAEILYRRALDILENVPESNNLDMAIKIDNMKGITELLLKKKEHEQESINLGTATKIDIMTGMTELLSKKKDYERYEPLFRRELAIREKIQGQEHSDIISPLNCLALFHIMKGEYKKAEQIYRRIITIKEKTFGSDHLEIVESLNNLAEIYRIMGDFDGAKMLVSRALTIREKALGPEHQDTATSLNNLAVILFNLGDIAQAETLYRRGIGIKEKTFGPDHIETAGFLNNLAELLIRKGDLYEAESLHRRVLAISEKVLGPEHLFTAASLNNLAELLKRKGDLNEAELLHRRALAIREKIAGPTHPYTEESLFNLGGILIRKGDLARAELLYKRALVIREKVFPDDKDTVLILQILGFLLVQKGDYAGAEPLYKRIHAINEKVLGPLHPETAKSFNSLVDLLFTEGDYTGVEYLLRKMLAVNEQIWGPSHLDTIETVNTLAFIIGFTDHFIEAEPLFRRALAIREKILGPEDPITAGTLHNLSFILFRKGDYEEAELLIRRALAIREKVLGTMHPDTQKSRENLATLLEMKSDEI